MFQPSPDQTYQEALRDVQEARRALRNDPFLAFAVGKIVDATRHRSGDLSPDEVIAIVLTVYASVGSQSLRQELAEAERLLDEGAAKVARLEEESRQLRQLLVDADFVARARVSEYGICDQIDNCGRPYPSAWAAEILKRAKETTPPDPNLLRHAG